MDHDFLRVSIIVGINFKWRYFQEQSKNDLGMVRQSKYWAWLSLFTWNVFTDIDFKIDDNLATKEW